MLPSTKAVPVQKMTEGKKRMAVASPRFASHMPLLPLVVRWGWWGSSVRGGRVGVL